MPMHSRNKGKRGEREWAEFLRGLGLNARRGAQFAGGQDSPDVVGSWTGTHPEVKRVETLNITTAVEQAVRDAGPHLIPYVSHRRNHKPWLITIRAEDVIKFAQAVLSERLNSRSPDHDRPGGHSLQQSL